MLLGMHPIGADAADWSSAAYDERGWALDGGTVGLPAGDAGRTIRYVLTNYGSSTQSVVVPASGVAAGSDYGFTSGGELLPQPGDALNSGAAPDSSDTGPSVHAYRGFPGQHTILSSFHTEGSPRVGALSGDPETLNTADGDIATALIASATDNISGWSVRILAPSAQSADTAVQTAGTALLGQFLVDGAANDIVDVLTAIFGDPWGAHPFGNIIDPDTRDIDILLYDIDGDGVPVLSGSRTVGYFWSKDNFAAGTTFPLSDGTEVESNGRLMFYLDLPLLLDDSDEDGTWELLGDFWPREVLSTLGHEFQHMIHYYQRVVRAGDGGYDTWLNELNSLVAEDILAHELGVPGPRGVDPLGVSDGSAGAAGNYAGRLPEYNATGGTTDVSRWGAAPLLQHYAASYALGAYLVRVGGVGLFSELMARDAISLDGGQGITASQAAVATALGSLAEPAITWAEVLRRWGVAYAVSDDPNVPPVYRINNGGWFTSAAGGATWRAGSIRAENYATGIDWRDAAAGPVTVAPQANRFVTGGGVPAGGATIVFALPVGVAVTVLVE